MRGTGASSDRTIGFLGWVAIGSILIGTVLAIDQYLNRDKVLTPNGIRVTGPYSDPLKDDQGVKRQEADCDDWGVMCRNIASGIDSWTTTPRDPGSLKEAEALAARATTQSQGLLQCWAQCRRWR